MTSDERRLAYRLFCGEVVEAVSQTRFWVAGKPRSQGAENQDAYRQRIRDAAGAVVKAPSVSIRIDIEVFFVCESRSLRADVDNIAKPILDALKGVAYLDDNQVRSIRIIALPMDDPFKADGKMHIGTFGRLVDADEFLVLVRDDEALDFNLE